MSAEVTRINPEHVKEGSVPDVLRHVDGADASFVVHITNGKWTLQPIKGKKTLYEIIGILRCVSSHLERMVNK